MLIEYRFRWVSCQLDCLANCYELNAVRDALATLPETLDATYTKVLENLQRPCKKVTYRLLQFLAYSERPLRIEEAVDALAVDFDTIPRFDEKSRIPDPGEISKFCSTLIVVVTREQFLESGEGESLTEVQLAHASVKEYLTSRLETQFNGVFGETVARGAIAETCLAYLLDIPRDSPPATSIRYPMARFAAQYWADHAATVIASNEKVDKLVTDLLTSQNTFTLSCELYDSEFNKTRDSPERPKALYHASLNGFRNSVSKLLETGVDINHQAGFYNSALQAASARGHLDIVQVLLENGADVNIRSGMYGSALQVASERGHLDIVRVLLENGADINVGGGMYDSVLQVASEQGHLDIVRVLEQYRKRVEKQQ